MATKSAWRAKLGLLVDSLNTVVEKEMHMVVPKSVSFHTARMLTTTDTSE